jgi:hypothetical protein
MQEGVDPVLATLAAAPTALAGLPSPSPSAASLAASTGSGTGAGAFMITGSTPWIEKVKSGFSRGHPPAAHSRDAGPGPP